MHTLEGSVEKSIRPSNHGEGLGGVQLIYRHVEHLVPVLQLVNPQLEVLDTDVAHAVPEFNKVRKLFDVIVPRKVRSALFTKSL